jgi:hypothetical protein
LPSHTARHCCCSTDTDCHSLGPTNYPSGSASPERACMWIWCAYSAFDTLRTRAQYPSPSATTRPQAHKVPTMHVCQRLLVRNMLCSRTTRCSMLPQKPSHTCRHHRDPGSPGPLMMMMTTDSNMAAAGIITMFVRKHDAARSAQLGFICETLPRCCKPAKGPGCCQKSEYTLHPLSTCSCLPAA